ncbi:ATP-binding protein [Actinomadura soli]|uniref:ATP-binding protein n=1 Tax=Actinomadura soli TaxID=2508997 RepID=A0A5C4JJ29_9ACTN|nr:ATP-binding protein [Actinomadura soli]TMR07046.1 ATP-binding protein [Actinomadura soli]
MVKRVLRAVAGVRTFVRLVVGGWGVDDFVPCLIAGELVTNAIRYAIGPEDEAIFRIGRTPEGVVWVEVQDAGEPGRWRVTRARSSSRFSTLEGEAEGRLVSVPPRP